MVAFRGTESLRDWMTDAKARLVPAGRRGGRNGRGARVHRGFVGALDYVWDDVAACIKDFRGDDGNGAGDRGRPVWLTGHSLGGALAILAAQRLAVARIPVKGLYTFGAPRAGNSAFAEALDRRLKRRAFRVVNNEDIVTRLPPRLLGYRHAGTVIYFDDKGAMHRGIRRWHVALNRWASATRRACARHDELRTRNPNSAADHSLDRYIENIKKNLRAKRPPKTFLEYVNV